MVSLHITRDSFALWLSLGSLKENHKGNGNGNVAKQKVLWAV